MSDQRGFDLRPAPECRRLLPGLSWLRGFAGSGALLPHIEAIAAQAPWRHLVTPGGGSMSVAMTNCGQWGWHSDVRGYRYVADDPLSDRPWPAMPPAFVALASTAAAAGGFDNFEPDCCLVNRYAVGAQMGVHRDYDEQDLGQPIVSVSIGLPAVFAWHGPTRTTPAQTLLLEDGDVLVWGGAARAGYHGVRKLRPGVSLLAGAWRYNLTFRRAR